ncbi:hypothetical protein H5T55_04870 [Candidatus Bipolaricaulota bacterium]|nr:hypothetical protein [Candidatus Bipolaricaulota bacterium]
MKRLAPMVALLFVGAVGQFLPFSSPAPDEVLAFLQAMEIAPTIKAAFSPVLGAGLAAGRATPQVSLELLRRLAELPAREAEEALDVFRKALERGFIVDTGAGSSLMNRVLMRLRMGAPWELVKYELAARYNALVATEEVLLRHALIGRGAQAPGGPVLPRDRLILEIAWVVADYQLDPQPRADPLEASVRVRLVNLSGSVLSPSIVEPVLAALTPELLQEIAGRVFQIERR